MSDYLTEQEQVELLKGWIKQYSTIILSGVLVAFLIVSGWRYWQQREYKIYTHASALFDEMLTQRLQHASGDTQASKLLTHYAKTPYSQFAALLLAKDAIAAKNYALAEQHFNWVINHSSITAIRQISRLRLARLYTGEQKPERALDVLKTIDDKSFIGLVDEVKGDVYVVLKNIPLARQSYQLALTELPNAEVIRPLLQMKYDNLATH